jgi:hypothetical protein
VHLRAAGFQHEPDQQQPLKTTIEASTKSGVHDDMRPLHSYLGPTSGQPMAKNKFIDVLSKTDTLIAGNAQDLVSS